MRWNLVPPLAKEGEEEFCFSTYIEQPVLGSEEGLDRGRARGRRERQCAGERPKGSVGPGAVRDFVICSSLFVMLKKSRRGSGQPDVCYSGGRAQIERVYRCVRIFSPLVL